MGRASKRRQLVGDKPIIEVARNAQLDELVDRLIQRWPEHANYVEKSIEHRDTSVLAVSNALAGIVLSLGAHIEGGVEQLLDDYRFLCEKIVRPEEIYFRRYGRYRLSRFADAESECYANAPFMNRYMNGLILSGVVWSNHAHAFAAFVNDYLPRLPAGAAHLEIGPGHGAFLYFAARSARIARIVGWDISPTSIANTRAALANLGVERPVDLKLGDLFDTAESSDEGRFDSIVMSEIIEHLENPIGAMRAASRHLKPGAHLWINVPANSPAPDHIYLVEGPDHARGLVEEAGLEVVDTKSFPMSGVTLQQAVKGKMAISCVVLGRKPGEPSAGQRGAF